MDHIDTLKNIKAGFEKDEWMKDDVEALEHAIKALEKEKETGVWIQHEQQSSPYQNIFVYYECSKCHTISHNYNSSYHYCPDCGTKMGGTVYGCY